MPKAFHIPYCTKNIYSYFELNSTSNELHRLRQYLFYQKRLRVNLIKQQRLLVSECNRRINRFNCRISMNERLFDPLRFLRIHSNFNEKQLVDTQENYLHIVKETESILHKNENINLHKKIFDTNIKLCSTIIANGHGIKPSANNIDTNI